MTPLGSAANPTEIPNVASARYYLPLLISDLLSGNFDSGLPPSTPLVPRRLPWVGMGCADGASSPAFNLHYNHLCHSIAAHVNVQTMRRPTAYSQSSKHDQAFHIVFYDLLSTSQRLGFPSAPSLQNTVPFYGRTDFRLRKGSFTVNSSRRIPQSWCQTLIFFRMCSYSTSLHSELRYLWTTPSIGQ